MDCPGNLDCCPNKICSSTCTTQEGISLQKQIGELCYKHFDCLNQLLCCPSTQNSFYTCQLATSSNPDAENPCEQLNVQSQSLNGEELEGTEPSQEVQTARDEANFEVFGTGLTDAQSK